MRSSEKGTPRNIILQIASLAEDAAVLVEEKEDGFAEVYAAFIFSKNDTNMLENGKTPESFEKNLSTPAIQKNKEDDCWLLNTSDSSASVRYKIDDGRVLMAADTAALKLMTDAASGKSASLGKRKWADEKDWPGHVEICDGGMILSPREKGEDDKPLKLQIAWHDLKSENQNNPAGEARWRLIGLSDSLGHFALNSIAAKTWDTSQCVIPEPLLMSLGLNIPELKGEPKDWPFPLNSLGELASSMKLTDKQTREILSGQTIFSLGGQNRILWFTLPGMMMEFTGDTKLMKELVDAFWANLFLGSEPKPVEGFEYGGTASLPFSVIGAGRGNIAILGLTTPESLRNSHRLDKFLKNDEKAIGWMVADLPRIGSALSDMTKMNSIMGNDYENDEDENSGLTVNSDGHQSGEAFQPDLKLSPFDESITDSFGNVLRKLGNAVIVWEKVDSGRLTWYPTLFGSKESK